MVVMEVEGVMEAEVVVVKVEVMVVEVVEEGW
jgi:hypothetical protein